MKKNSRLITLFLIISFLTACKKNDDAKVSIKLTDDPFPMKIVNKAKIGIAKIELKNENGNYAIIFNGSTQINMVEYTNGSIAEIKTNSLPPGNYIEAKISLNNAYIELSDGRNFDASFSSSKSYSVPINPPIIVNEGEETDLLLDLDLSDSFGFKNNSLNNWINDVNEISGLSFFSPDFRAVNLSQTGSIEGTITDENGNHVAYAYVKIAYDYNGDGKIENVSTISDKNGYYAIIGLPKGNYTVSANTASANGKINVQVNVKHNIAANITIN